MVLKRPKEMPLNAFNAGVCSNEVHQLKSHKHDTLTDKITAQQMHAF